MGANTDRIDSFRALALPVTCHAVNQAQNRTEARSHLDNYRKIIKDIIWRQKPWMKRIEIS